MPDGNGSLQHILSIESLSLDQVHAIFKLAETYTQPHHRFLYRDLLKNLTVINLFLEESTRTRTSFELAAKRLGADVINIAPALTSLKKGESLRDTIQTLQAMSMDVLVIRHPESGAADFISRHVKAAVINAGDGTHEHPTQALLDAFTIMRKKGRISGLNIAICGDILHSRVARSNIILLGKMGATLRLVGPKTLLPNTFKKPHISIHYQLENALENADVVMMLRLQQERMQGSFIPSLQEYQQFFGLKKSYLKKANPDVIIMHPGPMNRGVEIDSDIADDPQYSVILEQVQMGVAVRMACLSLLTKNQHTTIDSPTLAKTQAGDHYA